MYDKYIKRVLDVTVTLPAIIVLLPVFFVLTILGAVAMRGNPFFVQPRPGKDERVFKLLKFRSMNCRRDKDGELLPDHERLTGYGRFIRATSLDELPELFNILIGDMSLVGPRPQLVRDMVFMSEAQRARHSVRPGLTGLAQVNGRNNITWEEKFEYDLQYIENGISLAGDINILLQTAAAVLKGADTPPNGAPSNADFGDWLLQEGKITKEEYKAGQEEAKELLKV